VKVLAIDDNEEITEVLKDYLENNGVECKTYSNGRDGLLAIQNESYDLVLLDIAMPLFTGLDVIGSLKDQGLLSKKIVIMTASSDKDILDQLQASGIEILKKPCSIDELEEVIEKYRKIS
jgi:DNA-binding response OmpR family regulator